MYKRYFHPTLKYTLVALWVAVVGGCGQKGPLFVPGVPQETPWPYPQKQPTQTKEQALQTTPADVPARSEPN